MLVSDGGGGVISVEPVTLSALAAKVTTAAAGTSSARGSFAGAASAASGCQDPAAGSYARLQSILGDALAALDYSSAGLGRAVVAACESYVGTDNAQMACPPGP
jgi:hypothetical protein